MKRTFNYLGAITLLFFIVSCNGQTGRTDIGDNLADLNEDMREVIQTIDEALATEDISDFKDKTDDAVSSLDNSLDDYLNEMDNADRRVDQNSRTQVIEMKQKKVEVEFKLALLEQDDYDNWGDEDAQQDRTNTSTDMSTGVDRAATSVSQVTTGNTNSRTGTDRTQREITYGPQLVDDLKADLRDLKGKVQQFAQANLPQDRQED